MSKITLAPNASGTGTFTVASPNSNTNRTLNLPDASGTFNISGAVNEVPAGSTSAPSIYPTGDTNTGIYFPAADTIGLVCNGTEEFRVDGDGQLWNTVNSEVGTDYTTLYKGYLCRAWVNFNGTGTVAIRASGNVSSITDVGVGYYTVNFTTALPDTSYASNITSNSASSATSNNISSITTSGLTLFVSQNSALADLSIVCVSIFR